MRFLSYGHERSPVSSAKGRKYGTDERLSKLRIKRIVHGHFSFPFLHQLWQPGPEGALSSTNQVDTRPINKSAEFRSQKTDEVMREASLQTSIGHLEEHNDEIELLNTIVDQLLRKLGIIRSDPKELERTSSDEHVQVGSYIEKSRVRNIYMLICKLNLKLVS